MLKQSLFQRRRGLASLFIDLNGLAASSALVIPNVTLERASALLDLFSNPTVLRRAAEPRWGGGAPELSAPSQPPDWWYPCFPQENRGGAHARPAERIDRRRRWTRSRAA